MPMRGDRLRRHLKPALVRCRQALPVHSADRPMTPDQRDGQDGVVLLVVLGILLVVGGSSVLFISLMNQQQKNAGLRYRSLAAMALAESGVHRTLAVLETVTPDGRLAGRTWRPAGYAEVMPAGPLQGQFTLSLTDDLDGAVVVTSVGEAGGVARRLRARVYLTSPAVLAALYGAGILRLDAAPAAMFIVPYGIHGEDFPLIHLAAGIGIWFGGTGVRINDPSVAFSAGPGPIDPPSGAAAASSARLGAARVLLAQGAAVRVGEYSVAADPQQMRESGINVKDFLIRQTFPPAPQVDRTYYRPRAAANTANADLNKAAGEYAADSMLARKRDSLYTQDEFDELLLYLNAGLRPARLQGVVYIKGGVTLRDGQILRIADGTLLTEGPLDLDVQASLEVTHSARTRALPGIIVLPQREGELVVGERARLHAHGLVYVGGAFVVATGAHVEIVGSVLVSYQGFSFSNFGGVVVIRYDRAVLGTPGLQVSPDTPSVAWVASWEELP